MGVPILFFSHIFILGDSKMCKRYLEKSERKCHIPIFSCNVLYFILEICDHSPNSLKKQEEALFEKTYFNLQILGKSYKYCVVCIYYRAKSFIYTLHFFKMKTFFIKKVMKIYFRI